MASDDIRFATPKGILESLLPLQSDIVDCQQLQALWSNYGHVYAIRASSQVELRASGSRSAVAKLILKVIQPPVDCARDESFLRKILSYQVEQCFYQDFAPKLRSFVSLATCIATTSHVSTRNDRNAQTPIAMLMTDLREEFPVAVFRHKSLSNSQVNAAIRWLALFHSCSRTIVQPIDLDTFVSAPLAESKKPGFDLFTGKRALWRNGGYTYLETRQQEYKQLADNNSSEWSTFFCMPVADTEHTIAELAAGYLKPSGRSFESLVHGDVKSENMFSSLNGDVVAFFDFQYVGIGLGVCDLAKLFTCSVPQHELCNGPIPHRLPMCAGEEALLRAYLAAQHPPSMLDLPGWTEFCRQWETALVDWCRFQASWGFWGNTDWLAARVRYITGEGGWLQWVIGSTNTIV